MTTENPSVSQTTTVPAPSAPADPFLVKVRQLSEARLAAEKARLDFATLEEQWRSQPRVQAVLRGQEAAVREAAALEAEIRAEAVRLHGATGSKQPAPGVSIAVQKRVTYDEELVLRWAILKGVCVSLDARAFEAMARKNVPRDDLGVPLATVEDVATARIASDLAVHLGEVGQ